MEYTTKELEQRFGVKIRFFDPEEEPLLQTSYYDWRTDTIVLNKYLRGKTRLATLAHEIGHKHHVEELTKKGIPIITEGGARVEDECEAWKRGLPIAEELDVLETYRKFWRGAWFPVCVVCHCPFPGDDKLPARFSVGKNADYSFEEWMKLTKEYTKTGKWKGKQTTQEHVS